MRRRRGGFKVYGLGAPSFGARGLERPRAQEKKRHKGIGAKKGKGKKRTSQCQLRGGGVTNFLGWSGEGFKWEGRLFTTKPLRHELG